MSDKEEKQKEERVETYEITSEDIKTRVEIVKKDNAISYKLVLPEIDVATLALLDDIKERLISGVEMSASEVMDPQIVNQLKDEFKAKAEKLLKTEMPEVDEETKKHFITSLLHELVGLDEIEYFLSDQNLEEIVLNSSKEPIRVYHKKYGWLLTNITPASEYKIQNYANTIARRIGREITTLNPLLDAHLMTKDRANAILTPISSKGNTITIRKFARDPWTVTDFIKNKTVTAEVMSLIWLVMQYEMNIVISGGTGSGKTSFLNVCMPFVQPNHRIISIEDTRELQLPDFLYWCPLTTREPNPEGKGEVSMLDLLVNSLRMRPDRIVMGEVRKKREAEVLFEAMHTGHSVYCTIHADTCEQTITRITNSPIEIPHSMLESVQLNVVMFRDRRKGLRRIFEIGEFVLDEELAKTGEIRYLPNLVYQWNARDDTITTKAEPKRLYYELYRHTGLNKVEVMKDLETKTDVLNWMVKNNIRDVNSVGKVMSRYYTDQKTILDAAKENKKPTEILK